MFRFSLQSIHEMWEKIYFNKYINIHYDLEGAEESYSETQSSKYCRNKPRFFLLNDTRYTQAPTFANNHFLTNIRFLTSNQFRDAKLNIGRIRGKDKKPFHVSK